MEVVRQGLKTVLAAVLLAVGLSACGGGSSSTGGSETAAQGGNGHGTTTSAANGGGKHGQRAGEGGSAEPRAGSRGEEAAEFTPKPHHDSGGGSAQFEVKGGDNSVQEFGAEASESELQAAATALHGFLDARAERNWAAACAYLSKATKQGFAQLGAGGSGAAGRGCAAILGALSGRVPTSTLREAAAADVGSLRRQGDRGFLIFRGAPKGTIYAISVAREGDAWKVASLSGVPLS